MEARRIGRRALLIVGQLVVVVLIVILWQQTGRSGSGGGSFFFGKPSAVWSVLRSWFDDGTLFTQLWATLWLLIVGMLAGTGIGLVIGLAMGMSSFVRELIEPFVIFLNGIPRLVLQPFFIVWLGFGFISRVALVVSVIFVLVTISVSTAMTTIDQQLVLHARVLGASRWALVRQVYLPWLAVDLVGASRSNIGFAFQAALVAEFVGGASGLGYLMVHGQNAFDVNAVWAALVVVVVVSVLIDVAMAYVQNFSSRWLPSPA